ncbi:heme ABC exporter ATP-binding protein CcmA [Acidipila sp. 4G-K13]|uniref:Heme ABC exporter ATP-binding protein CcmA n=2 Tax=Paracidobacterium acidisoli TaxID=2303751 RepID=A0A372ISS7_9BACT|nr:heme ABC exporter ATP-binding protein CcmA [Paracidobacterium acidisoli]MBT9330753.1 heme ABC exporter ATP-binding protein CcmA [Paracidobacterium acidisoli]
MPEPIAELESVSKLYGTFAALRKVSVSFERGRCYVVLGANGAGKSTLLRMLAGLLRPSYGRMRVFGEEDPANVRDRIGYMSHATMLYDEFTGVENLRYFANLYRGRACMKPEEALEAVGLDPSLNRPVGQYSQGMRQRASLARVLLSQPELLLLDEPFSNMDIESAHQMLRLLETFRSEQRTILLTTHQRELAEPLADFMLRLRAGSVESLSDGPHAQGCFAPEAGR